jgi:DNA-binding beta-propeller fold protein YncE
MTRILSFVLALLTAGAPVAATTVEWQIQQTLTLKEAPLDMVVSPDGRFIYVLAADGTILMYGADGTLADTIAIGQPADRLQIDPSGERLLVTSRDSKILRIVALEFIRQIDVTGSPFKGPANAPVVIAVFSDFQ